MVQIILQEHIQLRIVGQFSDVPVPQVVEEILAGYQGYSTGAGVGVLRGAGCRCARSASL